MQEKCIIVPCYNESVRLDVNEFGKCILMDNGVYFLFVNDGSTDDTDKVFKNIHAMQQDRILILNLEVNEGKAAAIRKGMLRALEWKEFPVLGYLDADLSTPLVEVTRLISFFDDEKLLFIFGSRISKIGSSIDRKWYRHYLGRFFATMASKLLRLKVYDTQCGAKFFRREVVEHVFTTPFQTTWIFDLEIFHRFLNYYPNEDINIIAKEVPLISWVATSGSKIKFLDFVKVPFELIRLYFCFKKC